MVLIGMRQGSTREMLCKYRLQYDLCAVTACMCERRSRFGAKNGIILHHHMNEAHQREVEYEIQLQMGFALQYTALTPAVTIHQSYST